MSDRDADRSCSKEEFIATLRRVADALDSNEPVRIQVLGTRFTVPSTATFSIEHEVEGGEAELELQARWKE